MDGHRWVRGEPIPALAIRDMSVEAQQVTFSSLLPPSLLYLLLLLLLLLPPQILLLNGSHDRETASSGGHDGPMTAADMVQAVSHDTHLPACLPAA